jgi:hypothetical protein
MKAEVEFKNVQKPFVIKLGFEKLIQDLEGICATDVCRHDYVYTLLDNLKFKDILIDGFLDPRDWKYYEDDVKALLSVVFPQPLMKNEIKVALAPFSSEILYATDRFKSIFGETGEVEVKEFLSVDQAEMYILMCKIIMKIYYNTTFHTDVKTIYEVKDSRGISKFYKSTYNADFMTLKPLENAPVLTDADILELRNNTEDINLWKKYFAPNSWEVTGVGLKSFVDVTHEEALGRIKNILISSEQNTNNQRSKEEIDNMMSSLLQVPNVHTTFIMYDPNNERFHKTKDGFESYTLGVEEKCDKSNLTCSHGMELIFENKKDHVISNIDVMPDDSFDLPVYRRLKERGVKSYILAPLFFEDQLLGLIELVSMIPNALEPTQSIVINEVKDLCINAVQRMQDERENQLSSIIQKEFTSIHPSVAWKFRDEAEKAILSELESDSSYSFSKIAFNFLTALYGQSDISGSSLARNQAIAADLKTQMALVHNIVAELSQSFSMPLLDNIMYQIGIINEKLSSDLAAGMEQEVLEFLRTKIIPLFEEMRNRDAALAKQVDDYFKRIGDNMEVIYEKRKAYDDTVKLINAHLSSRLDKEQLKAQNIYPHFFERYKTDGVEHNMYIGQEIAPKIPFNSLYLDNLRLWQLKVMCQLELEHDQRMKEYPMQLEIASLIMVYSNPLAIRYRMDEKQFDIDGAYNARYEIIKKRIDKANIKGTDQRITQPGKIIIIYTQASDLEEYLNYASFLTYHGYLTGEPELFDIEDLQGIVGLKGLRVCVNFDFVEANIDESSESSLETKRVEM